MLYNIQIGRGATMKKKLIIMSTSLFIVAACAISVGVFGAKTAYSQIAFGEQCQKIIDALNLQASNRIQTGENCQVNADTMTVVNDVQLNAKNFSNVANVNYPDKFDLRNCDLDGTGINKDYVTSVKFQNPWGTCWAFAGIAASETSILSELRQNSFYTDAQGNKHDSLDLSEHHLSWFNYSPMQAFETSTQAGEGAYSTTEEEAKGEGNPWWLSQRMATGGVAMSTNSSFAMGMGVVREPNFNDTSVSPLLRQLLYKGINGTTTQTSKGYTIFSKDDDWSIDYSNRFMQDYKLEQGVILPNAKTPAGQDPDWENSERVAAMMKEQLLAGRALNIAFKADKSTPEEPDVGKYLNPFKWAQFTFDQIGASHDVTVVGWDDTYSRDNFLEEHKPPKDGAWIVKNSWGSLDSWGQGLNISKWGYQDSGYFYMSYYDQSLGSEEAYDFDVSGTSAASTITNQYDFMPCEQARAIEEAAPVMTANVFTASQPQYITEIGVMTSTKNETATYQLYKLADKNQRIDKGQLLCTKTENYKYKGFRRVKLGSEFFMNQGDVFAVTKTEQSGNKYLMGVASDANKAGSAAGKAGDNYYCIGIVNPGESFLYTSTDDKWTDFSIIKKELESGGGDAKYYTYDNFPIKAYGVPVSPQPQPVDDPQYLSAETLDSISWSLISSLMFIVVLSLFVILYTRKVGIK